MSEEVLFEVERSMSNSEIAENLRDIAEKIDTKNSIELESSSQSVVLDTDRPAEFEIKVERENGEESLELEIEWKNSTDEDFKLK